MLPAAFFCMKRVTAAIGEAVAARSRARNLISESFVAASVFTLWESIA